MKQYLKFARKLILVWNFRYETLLLHAVPIDYETLIQVCYSQEILKYSL